LTFTPPQLSFYATKPLGYIIGPWIGGLLYDALHENQPLMWTVIASSALLSAIGFATAKHKASAEKSLKKPPL